MDETPIALSSREEPRYWQMSVVCIPGRLEQGMGPPGEEVCVRKTAVENGVNAVGRPE